MIQLENIEMTFNQTPLFKDVNFALQRGERCGLIGRNGSGKSTLLRLITGEEIPNQGIIRIPKNYQLGYLKQHILFTKPTVLEEVALGLPPGEEQDLYKVEIILSGLGLTPDQIANSPHILSGGYQLRLQLAKVLISNPDCLLLDEPTNYLDILSMRWMREFLKNWKREFILISHDREFLDEVTTHTLGLHRQKIRKLEGSSRDLFEQILIEEEVQEKTRLNLEKKKSHAKSYIERFGAKASKATQAQSRKKMIDRLPTLERLKEIYHLDFAFLEAPFPGKKLLEVNQLGFSYPNHQLLIDNVSFSLEKGERLAIIGKNGSGKSTLLQLIFGNLLPQTGIINLSANVVLGYFGQTNIDQLHLEKTIEEEIAEANPHLNLSEVRKICGTMMFSSDLAKKKISVLSGGERSRVLLGKILAVPCNLLLLDEPTHHLDIESVEALIDAIEDFSGAVILVTHSELILKRLVLDKLLICHEGRQELFLGNYDEFLEKKGWEEEKAETKAPKAKKNPSKRKILESQIKKLEKEIIALEEDLALINQKMMQISPQVPEMHHLASLANQKQVKLDLLYADFDALVEALTNEY